MRKEMYIHNFIVYLLFIVFVLTGAGYGLGEECQVYSLSQIDQNSKICVPTVTASGNLHIFQVKERSSSILQYRNFQNGNSESTLRGSFVFLCVLALLSVYFQLIHKVFVCHQRLYVHDRFYMITFMQDIDGRKRFS